MVLQVVPSGSSAQSSFGPGYDSRFGKSDSGSKESKGTSDLRGPIHAKAVGSKGRKVDSSGVVPNRDEGSDLDSSRATGSLLRAGIVHSEKLPPIPVNLRKGAVVDGRFEGASFKIGATRQQFVVPGWLAGTWERVDSTEKSRIELPSGKKLKALGRTTARSRDKFGTFKDGKGRIWQLFDPSRASGEVDRGEVIDRHVVKSYVMEEVEPNLVSIEVQAYHMVVSKDGRRILHSYQDEELNTYRRVEDGVVITDSSVKVFDSSGKPTLLTVSESEIRRISPFNP